MAIFNYNATVGERVPSSTNAQNLETASRVGQGFQRLAGAIGGAYDKYQQDKADAVKKQKIDAIVMEYNNPNSAEYKGMEPYQRALKVARLLYPLDASMSQRYEEEARRLKEKGIEQQSNLALESEKTKREESKLKQKEQEQLALDVKKREALDLVTKATADWETGRDDVDKIANLRNAINNAKALGLNPENPIDDYLREKYAQMGLSATEQQREWQRGQTERQNKLQEESVEQKKSEDKYKNLDNKYPKLRTELIPLAQNVVDFIAGGDSGSISDRNQAVRTLSRIGSNEALSEQDFSRAVGRNAGTGVWSNLMRNVAGVDLAITDEEWKRLRSTLVNKVKAIKSKRDKADSEYGGDLLEDVDTSKIAGGVSSGASSGTVKNKQKLTVTKNLDEF